jgi:hypothetical protein
MTALKHLQRRRAALRSDISMNRKLAGTASAAVRAQLRAAVLGASIGRLLAGRSPLRALAGVSVGIAAAAAAGRFLTHANRPAGP